MRKSNSKNKTNYHYTVIDLDEDRKEFFFTRFDIMDKYSISDYVIRKYLLLQNYHSRKINNKIKIIKETRKAFLEVPVLG